MNLFFKTYLVSQVIRFFSINKPGAMFFSHWVESRGMLSSGISKQSQTSLEFIVLNLNWGQIFAGTLK